jgi:hypothetical protein
MIKLEQKIKLRGTPRIELVYKDGTRVLHYEDDNLVTMASKQAFLSFLYLSSQTSDPITTLWVGTGGTIDPAGLYPKPVPTNPTSLYSPLLSVTTSYTVDNTVPAVTFLGVIDEDTGAGNLISEAALYKASNTIFNMRTFPGIAKTNEFAISIQWTLDLN